MSADHPPSPAPEAPRAPRAPRPSRASEIDVFVADEQSDHPVDTMRWVRLARAVLGAEGVRGKSELSMLFVDEMAMADLHQRFLGIEGPTDVLAFPLDEDAVERGRSPDSGGPGPGAEPSDQPDAPLLLGDVVVCPAVAHRNAPVHAGTYDDELALLIVHGILHLLGMDHETEDEAEAMEQREQELLDRFHRFRSSTSGTPKTGTRKTGTPKPGAGPGPRVTDR